MKEIEVKFKIENIREIREKIKGIDTKKESKVKEENIAFDTKDQKLRKSGELLRLRRAGRKVILTYKTPHKKGEFKEMEELETKVEDYEQMKQIFQILGFTSQWGCEKTRETWRFKNSEILVDQLSFGNFLEIEGSKKEIKEITKLLGLNWKQRITKNYMELYHDYCKKEGVEPQDFF